MRSLLAATRNAHKTSEIAAILGPSWRVEDLTGHPEASSPEETGATFLENAAIKALAASEYFDTLILSDDSGLEVDALGGEPGIRSARYAGEGASDKANRAKLLLQLRVAGVAVSRRARFICAIAIARKGSLLANFSGVVEGRIIEEERGAGGFGYDPLFIPAGFEQTFAELPERTKNEISHRSRAIAQSKQFLETTPGA